MKKSKRARWRQHRKAKKSLEQYFKLRHEAGQNEPPDGLFNLLGYALVISNGSILAGIMIVALATVLYSLFWGHAWEMILYGEVVSRYSLRVIARNVPSIQLMGCLMAFGMAWFAYEKIKNWIHFVVFMITVSVVGFGFHRLLS